MILSVKEAVFDDTRLGEELLDNGAQVVDVLALQRVSEARVTGNELDTREPSTR